MRIRTLFPLTIALLALVPAVACGDDDNPSGTPTSSATKTASAGATSNATATPTTPTPILQPTASPSLFVTPSRELPPADHTAIAVFDVLTFYDQHLHGAQLTPIICSSFDFVQGIIDCAAQGYGTIAVDPIPDATGDLQCRVLLDPQNVFFAASCSGILASGPGAYLYAIQS